MSHPLKVKLFHLRNGSLSAVIMAQAVDRNKMEGFFRALFSNNEQKFVTQGIKSMVTIIATTSCRYPSRRHQHFFSTAIPASPRMKPMIRIGKLPEAIQKPLQQAQQIFHKKPGNPILSARKAQRAMIKAVPASRRNIREGRTSWS